MPVSLVVLGGTPVVLVLVLGTVVAELPLSGSRVVVPEPSPEPEPEPESEGRVGPQPRPRRSTVSHERAITPPW